MTGFKGNCSFCGAPLVYADQVKEYTCVLCGKREKGHVCCKNGHYVCNECHRKEGIEYIVAFCKQATGKDPVALACQMMRGEPIYANGPEHHTLVGAALLTAYRNSGGELDLDHALDELVARSTQVPGGACGFWGVCGAALSTGMFYSIVTGDTPYARKDWGEAQELTSLVLKRISESGGPRCCKRTCFDSLEVAVPFVAERLGVAMERVERPACEFFGANTRCLGKSCRYNPRHAG